MHRTKQLKLQDNAYLCNVAITAVYDVYAQRNISNFRKNLSTGKAYTQEDKQVMDNFIDSKRGLYDRYKKQILSVDEKDEEAMIELGNLEFDYK